MKNDFKIRLKEYKQGWIVEYKTFWRWKPVTTYAGLDNPFYYESGEEAIKYALEEIESTIVFNYRYKTKTFLESLRPKHTKTTKNLSKNKKALWNNSK